MAKRPASGKELPSPPQSGLSDILNLFQKIEDKYVSGKKTDEDFRDIQEDSLSLLPSPEKSNVPLFAQSTEDIFANRMQEVLFKYSKAESMLKKKQAQSKPKLEPRVTQTVQAKDKIFGRNGSSMVGSKGKEYLRQPELGKDHDLARGGFKKIKGSQLVNTATLKQTDHKSRDLLARRKNQMVVDPTPTKQTKAALTANQFKSSFLPSKSTLIKRGSVISKALEEQHNTSSASLTKPVIKDKIFTSPSKQSRIHLNSSSSSRLKFEPKSKIERSSLREEAATKERLNTSAVNKTSSSRRKVKIKIEHRRLDSAKVRFGSGPKSTYSRGFLSSKASTNNSPSRQPLCSNIYFPVPESEDTLKLNSYITIQKQGSNPDSSDRQKSALSDMFHKTNKRRLMTPTPSSNNSFAGGHSKDTANKYARPKKDFRSPSKASEVASSKDIGPRKDTYKDKLSPQRQWTEHSRKVSGTVNLYKNQNGPDSSILEKSKSKVSGGQLAVKRSVGKKSGDKSKSMAEMRELQDDLDSMTEFTMLEDMTKNESELPQTEETLVGSSSIMTPALSSAKKVRILKDDIESDKHKIEKDHKIFGEVSKSANSHRHAGKDFSAAESPKSKSSCSKIIKKGKSLDSDYLLSPLSTAVRKYYTSNLLRSLQKTDSELSEAFFDHLKHTVQSISYVLSVEKPHQDDLLTREVYLPPLARKGNNSSSRP